MKNISEPAFFLRIAGYGRSGCGNRQNKRRIEKYVG